MRKLFLGMAVVLIILYVVCTIFAVVIRISDYKNCGIYLEKLRAEGIAILIRCGEKTLRETQKSIFYAPCDGLVFTVVAVFLLFIWVDQKIKSFHAPNVA